MTELEIARIVASLTNDELDEIVSASGDAQDGSAALLGT